MLTQNLSSHKELLKLRTEQIDRLNEQLREFSALQQADLERLQELKDRVKLRSERQAKVANLKRAIQDRKTEAAHQKPRQPRASPRPNGPELDPEPHWLSSEQATADLLPPINSSPSASATPTPAQLTLLRDHIPDTPSLLRARLHAYYDHNADLRRQADELKSRSSELEVLYRKVVALCTGVPEERVEESLGQLVSAVESERGGLGEGEVGRVREFLRRVDGGGNGNGNGGGEA